VVVFQNAVYHVVGQAIPFGKPCKGFGFSVKTIQASACPDPEILRTIFIYGPDFVVAQTFRIIRGMEIALKGSGLPYKPVQSVVGTYPQGFPAVFINGSDSVMTQASGFLVIMEKTGKCFFLAIKQVHTAIPCPDPQILSTVFTDRRY